MAGGPLFSGLLLAGTGTTRGRDEQMVTLLSGASHGQLGQVSRIGCGDARSDPLL